MTKENKTEGQKCYKWTKIKKTIRCSCQPFYFRMSYLQLLSQFEWLKKQKVPTVHHTVCICLYLLHSFYLSPVLTYKCWSWSSWNVLCNESSHQVTAWLWMALLALRMCLLSLNCLNMSFFLAINASISTCFCFVLWCNLEAQHIILESQGWLILENLTLADSMLLVHFCQFNIL